MLKEMIPVDRMPTVTNLKSDYEHLVWACFRLVESSSPAACARRFIDCFPNPAAARLMTSADIRHLKTVGPKGIEKILPMLSLGLCVARAERPIIGHAYSSHEVGKELITRFAGFDSECVEVCLLDVHNEIIALEPLFIGGFEECPVYSSRVFQLAVKFGAHGIILAHNHPTGKWQPSRADLMFCQKLRKAAGLLNMELVDFLVVGSHGYYSWREHVNDVGEADRLNSRIG